MLLSEEDKKIIAEAIKRAELATSGEIVFAITGASGHYYHATLQGALIGTVLAAAVYLALPVPQTIGLLLWTEIIAFALFYSVIPHLPMRRWIVPAREMSECVHDAAFREFYASGLYKTRESNGVLIYLSFLECRVVVLGDKGIHEKMGDLHWNDVRDKIIHGIRLGKAREGICAAVESCGIGLAEHFPHRPDDINELPDEVIDRTQDPEVS
jgi:putative membrane protein